jgi:hypothetical protein
MTSATIKLFLPRGDAKALRTAEISNWTGKALAAPRTELDELLARKELDKAGVYILTGSDPETNAPRAYIGEAEVIRERLKQHRSKEFWVSAIVFVSKDENLTKAHVRYLESRSPKPPRLAASRSSKIRPAVPGCPSPIVKTWKCFSQEFASCCRSWDPTCLHRLLNPPERFE